MKNLNLVNEDGIFRNKNEFRKERKKKKVNDLLKS